jgi:hypothetical protein
MFEIKIVKHKVCPWMISKANIKNCEMISQPKIKDKKIICTTRSHASHDVNACIEAMKPDEILRQGRISVLVR